MVVLISLQRSPSIFLALIAMVLLKRGKNISIWLCFSGNINLSSQIVHRSWVSTMHHIMNNFEG